MIEIIKSIEREVENRAPNKTIFKTKSWLIKITFLLISILPQFILYLIFGNLESFYLPLGVLISCALFVMFFYGYVNKIAKKQLLKLGVEPSNGFWEHWVNNEYLKFKYKNFITELKAKKILDQEDDKKNIHLLDEYSKYFIAKAEKDKSSDILKAIGAIILVFFVPLWNLFLDKLYQTNNQKDFNLIILFLMLIVIFSIFLVGEAILKEIFDSKKRKMYQISDELLNIKWNIELKNQD